MSTHKFTVKPGDIFRDKDSRMSGGNRHLKVIEVDAEAFKARLIECAPDGREFGMKTRVGFHGLATKFEKVGGSTQVADLERAVLKAAEEYGDAEEGLAEAKRVWQAGDSAETYEAYCRAQVRARETSTTLRQAIADLRRARDDKGGEG